MPKVCRFSDDEMLMHGLALVGNDKRKQNQVKKATRVRRFKCAFGSSPIVCCAIFIDLQKIKSENVRLVVNKNDPHSTLRAFLISLYFLRHYSTEEDEQRLFGLCGNTIRPMKWHILRGIQHLKQKKIVWPVEWTLHPLPSGIPIFLVSVDGVHCEIQEPSTGKWSKDPKYYSHKFHKAGYAYEVALSVFENRCVHISGPFPASVHDGAIFKKSLRAKIPVGHLAIADNGYKGIDNKISKPNPLDTPEVRKFKGRARARQENFNARLKIFKVLKNEFRNNTKKEEKHKCCFEAVAVICQYQLELGSPLWDV